LLETFMQRSIQYLSSNKGVLFQLDTTSASLTVISSSKIPLMSNGLKLKLEDGGSIVNEVVETGEPKRSNANNIFGIEAKQVICVPLKSEREILGLVLLFDKESKVERENSDGVASFSERDEAMITSLANHTSTLWQKARFYEMATIDGLTQLYVRRFLEQRLAEEIRKSQRSERKLSLMLLDIDHFKKFNDTWGHQTGDDVLRIVAKKIKDNVRKGVDIPARYGGEELTVVMPETEINGAMILAERIRTAIESTELENPSGGAPLKVTVSIGVSTFPDHAKSLSEMIEKADIALYKSKASGRNQVTLYENE